MVQNFFAKVNAKLDAMDRYHMALGSFVSKFSQVECTLQTVLWTIARVSDATGKAVFSGVRPDQALSYLNRIADAEKWPAERKANLTLIADRLGPITKLRNDLLHYGATWHEQDVWQVSNATFAHIPDKLRVVQVPLSALREAGHDLMKIEHHLIHFAWSDSIPEDSKRHYEKMLASAWRYKPLSPTARPRMSQKARKGRQPPPQS